MSMGLSFWGDDATSKPETSIRIACGNDAVSRRQVRPCASIVNPVPARPWRLAARRHDGTVPSST